MKDKTEHLLADSRLAFLNEKFGRSLNLALEAIKLDPQNADAYKCAGNAYMSMERYDDAIKNFASAVKYDAHNGNRYFDLGFAYASNTQTANAMSAFAKAEELGCIPENLKQLYHILGIICFDLGRYDDALINLTKAEQLIGVDIDLLQRKAIIYGIKNDIRNGLHTVNQMKLIAPTEYGGYQVSFKLLMQDGRLDAAARELSMAQKYAKPDPAYYSDAVSLEVERYGQDRDCKHLDNALKRIDEELKSDCITAQELIDAYINAAELNLQLEKAEQTIACLDAALEPMSAYQDRFTVIEPEEKSIPDTEVSTAFVPDIEDLAQEEMERIESEYGLDELETIVNELEPESGRCPDFLTDISEKEEQTEDRINSKIANARPSKENLDQINRLYIGAYTLKQNYEKVLTYAKMLQTSDSIPMVHVGKYTEANALLNLGRPEATAEYQSLIKYFRNTMIQDPTDLMATTLRVQCYLDMKEYEEAEAVCELLTKEMREPLLKKIQEAKSGGKKE